ncbi:hypothetical protein FRC00_001511, partial [Tulasnella sp. 408]
SHASGIDTRGRASPPQPSGGLFLVQSRPVVHARGLPAQHGRSGDERHGGEILPGAGERIS